MKATRFSAGRVGTRATAVLAGAALATTSLLTVPATATSGDVPATAATPAGAQPAPTAAASEDAPETADQTEIAPMWAPVEPAPEQEQSGAPTLNLESGERVSGTVPVVSSPSVSGATHTAIEVDGEAHPGARTTLGSEQLSATEAALVLDVTAAVEISYSNYLMVNGARVAIREQIAHVTDHPIEIPAELLTTGPNLIEFHTGTRASTCGINHDDVVIGNFGLQLPGGELVTNPANPITGPAPGANGLYNIGDGNCGSSSKPRFLTVAFDVDADASDTSGLLLELDTTDLPDGEHTVTAVAGEETTSETVVVDNTGPALTASSPAAGDHLLGDVVLDATVADDAGVAGEPSLTLDGEPVAIGETISSDVLPAGEHVLQVETTDELGNTAVHTVDFTSAPSTPMLADLAPASGATGVEEGATLSATVADPRASPSTSASTPPTRGCPRPPPRAPRPSCRAASSTSPARSRPTPPSSRPVTTRRCAARPPTA